MNRWKLWLSLSVVTVLLGWWTANGLQRQALIQKNGNSFSADEVWLEGDKIFYQRGKEVAWLELAAVEEIVLGSLRDPTCYGPLLRCHFRDTMAKVTGLLAFGPAMEEISERVKSRGGHLMWMALVLTLGFLVFLYAAWGRKLIAKRAVLETGQREAADDLNPRLAGMADIEHFFLDLFREKSGALPGAPAGIDLIESNGRGTKRVVELKVKHEETWRSRRMTIAAIGENTGSKSQCFYVIYDTHMVVKVPPSPISDFEDYITRVRAGEKIMLKLAPKECVIPNVSVILKKIHTLPQTEKLAADLLEGEYIQWLRRAPEYQRFLKIAGSFVFFMDLSKYYFLSHVLESFHQAEDLIEADARTDSDILTDFSKIEAKYGDAGNQVWPDLNRAYRSFQDLIGDAVARSDEKIDLSDWQIKTWFLSLMAGREHDAPPIKTSPGFRSYLKDGLQKFSAGHAEIGRRYKHLVNDHSRKRLLSRNRPLMGAMVTNLLALLVWLEENCVAMRDLKPDNLLVAGSSGDYPQFLSSADNYAVGLIDLETAVDYERGSYPAILQPQLGGTPYYGTPSHFFPNRLLHEMHRDLPLIFQLQDWYAAIGIIYEIVTGEILFQRTASELLQEMKVVMQTAAAGGDLQSAYHRFSLKFWERSAAEIQKKLLSGARLLDRVQVSLPEKINQRLARHLQESQIDCQRRIERCLDSNPAFCRGDNRQRLLEATVDDLKRLRLKYEGREKNQELVGRIGELLGLKQKAENLDRLGKTLAVPLSEVTAGVLLEVMFDVVRTGMRPDMAPAMAEDPFLPEAEKSEAPGEEGETVQVDELVEQVKETVKGLGYSVTVDMT